MFNCLFTLENHLDLRCVLVNSTKQDKACGSGAESQFVVNRLI